ncbi:MAG: hypothetical protein CVV33_06425 [Methanomicrobiales archaeon HGW-Methanomicrobiales-4]|nr:MAG: hypothetical protein CVV33_06425 [Methanomicrobiales archaeon HGW-Methanomicrobiales-4]
MKLERNGIVAIIFVITFVILLFFSYLTSGFLLEVKGILVAIYFSVWVVAVVFVVLTFVFPYLADRKKVKDAKKAGSSSGAGVPVPFKSPRSGLPVRERIVAYVTERRREDGLSAPEPLRPSRTVSSDSVRTAGAGASQRVIPGSGITPMVSGVSPDLSGKGTESTGDDMGDLPLPDDFGSVDDSSGDMGSLPGLDDDFGDLGGFGGGDEMPPDFDGDNSGLLGDSDGIQSDSEPVSASYSDMSDGELPGFDGDINQEFGESELISDDGMMDLSGDDVLTMDDDEAFSSSSLAGSLSEEGLPDIDGGLEPDLIDSDLTGDEDFGDIEFMDLEPEEPKKSSK